MFDFSQFKDRIAVITDRNESLTYDALVKEVENFYSALPRLGLVFTLCENVLGSLVGYVACMNKKIPQVLLDGTSNSEKIIRLVEIYQPEYIWMPEPRACEFCGNTIYRYMGYCLREMYYSEPILDRSFNPLLQLCLTTSGTLGSPKLVRLSEINMQSNAESIAEYLQITQDERPVTSLPMHYSFGISVINSHLIKGAVILLTDKSIMQREFWDFIKDNRASSMAGVPYTYETLKCLGFFRMDLPEMKTMIQAGGHLNAACVKEYVEFAQKAGKKFIVMYGQTEASPRMSYLPFGKALAKKDSIGIAIPGGTLKVIDGKGNDITLPEVEGELVYQGENVCLGYATTREDLKKGDENHGVLHTGDVAKFDEDGFFYITGRMRRFVKVWGNRVNLDAIEQLVKTVTTSCACVGVDDNITIFVTEEGFEDEIKALLVEKTGFNPRAFQVKKINTIPLKTNGKTDYVELQKLMQNNDSK